MQLELAHEQVKQLLKKGYASYKHIWIWFMKNRMIRTSNYGRTGPEAYANITKKRETLNLFVVKVAEVAADTALDIMRGGGEEDQLKAMAMNKRIKAWVKFATANIVSKAMDPHFSARQLHADLQASLSIIQELEEQGKEGICADSVEYKMQWYEYVQNRYKMTSVEYMKEDLDEIDRRVRKKKGYSFGN